MRIKIYTKNQFFKDYRLPLQATLAFVLIVLTMLFVRTLESRSLANVLANNTNNDYAALISTDETDEFKQNKTEESGSAVARGPNEPEPPAFTVSPNSEPEPDPPDDDDDNDEEPAPPPPFSAEITNLALDNKKFKCADPNHPTPETCGIEYKFRGEIRAINGPGTVAYAWKSTVPKANKEGQYSAGSGETFTPVYNLFNLRCDEPQEIRIRLRLNEPNTDASDELRVSHECSAKAPTSSS